MWIKKFRQFLKCSFERIADWVRGLELAPDDLLRWWVLGSIFPASGGFGGGEMNFSTDAQHHLWFADLSYQHRSLTCQMRVRILDPTPGMQHIYAVLRSSGEE